MWQFGHNSEVKKFFEKNHKSAKSPYLIKALLESYNVIREDFHRYAKQLPLLDKLRKGDPSGAMALEEMSIFYAMFYYGPVEQRLARHYAKLDPFSETRYGKSAASQINDEYLEGGKRRFGNTHGFHHAAARLYKNINNKQMAIEHYQMALKIAPGQWQTMVELGGLLKDEGRHEEAIALYKTADDFGKVTLRGSHIISRMARSYLRLGRAKEALEIIKPVFQVYQGGVLYHYARALEMTGDLETAEKYFRKAAKRYPSGSSGADYASYYLRRGDEVEAARIIREYAKHNGDRYYVDTIIDDFLERDKPEAIYDFILEVEKGRKHGVWWDYYLSEIFVEKGLCADALKMLKKNIDMKNTADSYAAEFVKVAVEDEQAPSKEAVNYVFSFYKKAPKFFEYVGIDLFGKQLFEEAYRFFKAKYIAVDRRKDVALIMMAFSHKALGPDATRANFIRSKLPVTPNMEEQKDLVRYLIGDIGFSELRKTIKDPGQATEAFFAAGLEALADKKPEQAHKLFLISLDTTEPNYIEYKYADDFSRMITKRFDERYSCSNPKRVK